MRELKKTLISLAAAGTALAFIGCGESGSSNGTGTLSLALTDAPIDTIENIEGVYITITGIEYHTDGGWQPFEGFEGPRTFNMLDLTDGNVSPLGDMNLSAGHYTQLRFTLDAPEENGTPQGNPGCYLRYTDANTTPLYVPSGSQTGVKAIGEYDVPLNGTVTLTADFDVRKSVVEAGASGRYQLKPTIRLIATGEAGTIKGNIGNSSGSTELKVFAYEDGNYTASEAEHDFANAVTSTNVHPDGNFTIAFLKEGRYDLVVGAYTSGLFDNVAGYVNDIEVTAAETMPLTLSTSTLDADF